MRIRRAASALTALALFAVHGATTSVAAAEGAKGGHETKAHAAQAAKAKPQAKPAGKKGPPKHTRKAGDPGEPDEATRRIIAGTSSRVARESPELRAMRELDRALFPAALPGAGPPWLAEGTPLLSRDEPVVVANGMPPPASIVAPAGEAKPASRDLAWLQKLAMPDLPVRWDARVVRYLDFYKNNARGRSMVAGWLKKSGRYGGAIRRVLRDNGLPEDIVWLALIESGFDPSIQSPAGAAGLWQFMPEGARIYGLTVDRWIDERLDPERSTLAAARYLADLHTRFGSWELAFAAYNMGYGGLMASIRKYNTNDFWELSRLESGVPFETALYVPKIVAMAIVARNRAIFGLEDIELEPAVSFDTIAVRPGVSLQSVALASGTSTDRVVELNPQLTAGRVPPFAMPPQTTAKPAQVHEGAVAIKDATWAVRVPAGSAAKAAKSLPDFAEAEPKVIRYMVRWGETIDDIAARRHTTRGALTSLNGLRRDESLRPGTILLLPAPRPDDDDPFADAPSGKPVVVVPAQSFGHPEGQRVFYKVVSGDSLRDVASLFGVGADELCRWNALDPNASLHDGMVLQIYPATSVRRADVTMIEERDAQVLTAGSPEFFAHFEGARGRTRLELVAKQGDTWKTIAQRYGLRVAQLERINGRGRSSALAPGDKLVVYVPTAKAPGPAAVPAVAKPDEKTADVVAVAKPAEHAPVADEAAPKEDRPVAPPPLASVPASVPVANAPPANAPAANGKGAAAAPR